MEQSEGFNNGLLRDPKTLAKKARLAVENLSPQQREFCHAMLTAESQTAAAIAAGYSEKSAKSKASQLLTDPNIIEYIGLLGLLRSQAAAIDAKEIISLQLSTYYACLESGDLKAANTALDQLAKMSGLYKPLAGVGKGESQLPSPKELKSQQFKSEMDEMLDLVKDVADRKNVKLAD